MGWLAAENPKGIALMFSLIALFLCLYALVLLRAIRSPGRNHWSVPILSAAPTIRMIRSICASTLKPRVAPAHAADIRQLVLLVRRMAALLRGGRSASALWRDLQDTVGNVELAGLVSRVAAAAALGLSPAHAIREYTSGQQGSTGLNSPLTQLAAVLEISETSGAPLAALLERFADHLEGELDTEALRRTAMAGPRATARLLLWLPPAGLLIAAGMGIDFWEVFAGSPWGVLALGAGFALILLSRFWVGRLVARAGRL